MKSRLIKALVAALIAFASAFAGFEAGQIAQNSNVIAQF